MSKRCKQCGGNVKHHPECPERTRIQIAVPPIQPSAEGDRSHVPAEPTPEGETIAELQGLEKPKAYLYHGRLIRFTKEQNKWLVISHDGKRLGEFNTQEEAEVHVEDLYQQEIQGRTPGTPEEVGALVLEDLARSWKELRQVLGLCPFEGQPVDMVRVAMSEGIAVETHPDKPGVIIVTVPGYYRIEVTAHVEVLS